MTAPDVATPAEVFLEAEEAQHQADELRREAERIEEQAAMSAAELRTQADAVVVAVWPRVALLTKGYDPEQVARIESLVVEAGAVVAGRCDARLSVDANGDRVTESGLPIEGLPGVSPKPVYEITVAAPTLGVLSQVTERAEILGLTWPQDR